MSDVEKPEGYDLREKRADKASDAKKWTPPDALYSSAERIKGKEITQLVAYWWERQEDGSERLRWSNATTSNAEHALLLQKALNFVLNH